MKGIAANRFAWSSESGRSQEEKTLDTFLEEAAEAGYDAVECIDDGVEEKAGKLGLVVCSAYAGGPLHLPWDEIQVEEKFLKSARRLAELGGTDLLVNGDPKGNWGQRERKSEDDLKRQGENLSRLAGEVRALGLQVVLHNHANTHPLHLDDIRSVTDYAEPAVGMCLDIGWALTSGDDPVERLRLLGKRVRALHLRNQKGEVPTEWLGEGDIDLAEFMVALKETGYGGWLTTELWHRQDVSVTRSLFENQKASVALLRELM